LHELVWQSAQANLALPRESTTPPSEKPTTPCLSTSVSVNDRPASVETEMKWLVAWE
jgi:hypothetical protein